MTDIVLGDEIWKDVGIRTRSVPSAEVKSRTDLPWACFGSLSHWEVEADGHKIVGCRRPANVMTYCCRPRPWLARPLGDCSAM